MAHSGLSLALVVAAAGYGTRLQADLPKQYVRLLGISMIQRTLTALTACPQVDALLLVVNVEDVDYCCNEITMEHLDEKIVKTVGGGEKRPLSVRNGLQALAGAGTWDLVGVHDGARPLVTCREIERAVEALAADESLAGAVPGVPSVDTIKIVDEDGIVTSTPERDLLWRAQTPQIFRWRALMDAYDRATDEDLADMTDDASLVEAAGGRIKVVQGSPENFKITEPLDLQYAEQILARRRA